jgi:hypothetical protein
MLIRFLYFGAVVLSLGLPSRAAYQFPVDQLQSIIRVQSASMAKIQSQINEKVIAVGGEAQAQANQIPQVSVQPSGQSENVSDGDKNTLMDRINKFAEQEKSSETFYVRLALAFIIGAAILALLGSILSFAKKNVVAGVVGLIVTAIISFSNAYPLNALAEFHRHLEGQAYALQVDCETQRAFTADFYTSARSRLLALILARSTESPGFGNYKVPTRSTTDQQQTIKSTVEGLEKAKAELKGYDAGKG